MDSSKSALLPIAPSSLCFDKNEFMRKDFSVDKFVADCRRRVQLETLRQDLEIYFKLLKNAMIELINKDYADFVNLSSNLVGMDKAIAQLRDPLVQIKEDMGEISKVMDDKISQVDKLLQNQRDLMSNRDKLSHMIKLLKSVEKIEHIQASEDVNSGQVLERIAGEFNELQHHASFCTGLPVLSQVRPRISEITGNLQQRLEQLLIQGVRNSDVSLLHRCLNSYALIGKTKDAEKLVQAHLVHPYMKQVMDEQNGDVSPNGLQSLFNKIGDFVPNYCKLLCDITAGRLTKLSEQYRGIAGYDFIVRSVWPEIVESIENRLPGLFSPSYPDTFHSRYSLYMEFISNMEIQCGSQASVTRLRQSDDFSSFQSKWSLPVYFQMRFQEIGSKLEQAIENGAEPTEDGDYKLHPSAMLYSCIETCWKDNVFLPALIHRFWKVTLQCMARYGIWAKTILPSNSDNDASKTDSKSSFLPKLVGLSCDLITLAARIPEFFDNKIKSTMSKCGVKDTSVLRNSLENGLKSYTDIRDEITKRIIEILTASCSVHLRYAQDVPRLFRRTNREVPNRPSPYVSNILKSVANFKEEHGSSVADELFLMWVTECASNVSDKYFAVVSDVLTSVKKMEESLMRLQKMRAGKSSGNLQAMDEKKLSDDDKIRLQLYLDVVSFNEELTTLGIDTSKVSKLDELLTLVNDAKPDKV